MKFFKFSLRASSQGEIINNLSLLTGNQLNNAIFTLQIIRESFTKAILFSRKQSSNREDREQVTKRPQKCQHAVQKITPK